MTGLILCIIPNLTSDPEGIGDRDGEAYRPGVACLGTVLTLAAVAGDMTGSGGRLQGSCRRVACRHYRAYRAAGQREPGRDCLRVSRQGCRHPRHWRHRSLALARSSKPANGEYLNATRWQRSESYLDQILALGLGDERL